jgi:hypothetical protein
MARKLSRLAPRESGSNLKGDDTETMRPPPPAGHKQWIDREAS